MTTVRQRALRMVVWFAVLAAGAWLATQHLTIGADLRGFLPPADSFDDHLLLDQLGDQRSSRLLIVALQDPAAIDAAEPAASALAGRAGLMAEALQDAPTIASVVTGPGGSAGALGDELLGYRYVLTDRFDETPLSAEVLADALAERLADLASPAGAMVSPWIGRDPTLELAYLAEQLAPGAETELVDGVFFDLARGRALLLVETASGGFDAQAQAGALATIEAAFAASEPDEAGSPDGPTRAMLEIGGPGAITAEMRTATAGEATRLSVLAVIVLAGLLVAAFRSLVVPLVAALPLATGLLAGIAAVGFVFATVHGITLAFGCTLIGVAQDYPLHALAHQRRGVPARTSIRAIWPTLVTGALSTCLAYLSFLAGGVEGLQQLAVLTIIGLISAALATRYLLPSVLGDTEPPAAALALADRLAQARNSIAGTRVVHGLVVALALAATAAVILAPGPRFDDDLARLTPVPTAMLARDESLREGLPTPDLRYAIAVRGANLDDALTRAAALGPELDALLIRGAISGFDLPSRLLPPRNLQRERQQRLPNTNEARAMLDEALADTPFKPEIFEPFLAELEAARRAPVLTQSMLQKSPIGAAIDGQIIESDGGVAVRIGLYGITDVAALQALAADPHVELFDAKTAAESVVSRFRNRVLTALGGAAGLLLVALGFALRSARRVLRVIIPALVTTLVVVAVLRLAGVSLNLFHLISLLLGAGLGLDYALFAEAASERGERDGTTLFAVALCAISTLAVFALLATASIPVLQAIGTTVTLAVIGNFVLSMLLFAPRRAGPGLVGQTALGS